MYYTFLETLGKIQFNYNDSRHHDPHQEGQEDQEYPPSSRRFLMVIFPLKTPCVLHFWKPWAKSSSMIMTPAIMIPIRKVRMIRNVLQVQRSSWWKWPMYQFQIDMLQNSHVGGVWLSKTGHFIGCFPEYLLDSHQNIKKTPFWRVPVHPKEAKYSIF